MSSSPHLRPAASIVVTLIAAALGAWLFALLRMPLPWMLGPLLVTATLSVAGAPVRSWLPARNAGQWGIGTTLGLYFTPVVCMAVWDLAWAIALAVAWALLLGACTGWVLLRVQGRRIAGLDWRTTFLAGSVGGASEMTLLAERAGARSELVAAAHSLRMLIVSLALPLAMQWAGLVNQAAAAATAAAPPLSQGMLLTGFATLAGALLMRQLRLTNPWFLGSLFVAMALAALQVGPAATPRWLVNTAQLLIGVSLGVRFTLGFVRMAPSWMGTVAFTTLGMIAASAAFATLLAWWAHQPVATMVLATAPGGIGEMSITAKVLGLGAPIVTAFQVCRLTVVLLFTVPLMNLVRRWLDARARRACEPEAAQHSPGNR